VPELGQWGFELARSVSAAGQFGSDVLVPLLNSAGTPVNAIELVTSWRVNTAGSEEARWQIFVKRAAGLFEAGGFSMANGTGAMVYVGAVADLVGFRSGTTNMDVLIGGAAPATFSGVFTAGLTAHLDVVTERRLQGSASAGTISVNTLTTGNQNKCRVPGTPSIQGITISPWTDGARILLYCAATTVLVNNSGAPGAGAAKLLNVSGANITVGATPRVIAYAYDSTDNVWYQEG
jgi:hypothetical protein